MEEKAVEKGKIYCKNCRYLGFDYFGFHICLNQYSVDYYGKKWYVECCSKNENNNCKDYKRKWWKFWIS